MNLAKIYQQVTKELEEENALIDEYLALPDRPKVRKLVRATEVSKPEWCDIVDVDDFHKWRRERLPK